MAVVRQKEDCLKLQEQLKLAHKARDEMQEESARAAKALASKDAKVDKTVKAANPPYIFPTQCCNKPLTSFILSFSVSESSRLICESKMVLK